jgi:SAM-dependent methyltransferase
MTGSPSARFFDAIAGRYDREYALGSADSRPRLHRLVQALPPAPASVLDLGVGTGRELTALLDAGYAPTGLDASGPMLERCARRARPVPLLQADFWEPLPFDDGAFDAAIALHGTLAHAPDAGAMARLALELARVVRPGGAFVAEVPSTAWLDAAGFLLGGDRVLRRTGPRTCVYEDRVAGAEIEARILDEREWREAFGPRWTLRFEPLDALELFIVGQRG